MRRALLVLLPLAACGTQDENATTVDAALVTGDAADVADARPELFYFTSAMDAHLEAAPLRNEAGTIVPADVCCDSEIGCFTSPSKDLCRMVGAPYTPVDPGHSFRFWIEHSTANISLTIQTEEPADGFRGACLLGPEGRLADRAQLPIVCFALWGNIQYSTGTKTEVIARVAEVVTSDTPVTNPYDDYTPWSVDWSVYHYQVLMTCYPHESDGACPAGSSAVSRSCCDVGAPMEYLWAYLAHGFVNLSSM